MHKQVNTGLGFRCDAGIRELVLLLNAFPGIRTEFSCQGGITNGDGDELPYVLFRGSLADLENLFQRMRPLCDAEDVLHIQFQPDFMGRRRRRQKGGSIKWGRQFPSGGIRGYLRFKLERMEQMCQILRSVVE